MAIKKYILLNTFVVLSMLLALMISTPLVGQDISSSTLEWKLDESTDMTTQTSKAYNGTIRTFATQRVKWIQRGGEKTSEYIANDTEGSWTDTSLEGSFTYNLSYNGRNCTMVLERKSGGVFIWMKFGNPNNPASILRFKVQSIAVIN